jgi:hypothetical protein
MAVGSEYFPQLLWIIFGNKITETAARKAPVLFQKGL